MSDRERGAILSGLRNRLGWFLRPPFLELCSRSDFDIAQVTEGRSIGFLLPTGSFPDVAVPLGRVALAHFTQAVLSSTPERTKLAVLDEFHSFVDEHFAAFLNQARSYGGGAVMALQTIASIPREHRDELLANPSTVIVTPGCMPFDAEHVSKVFGETQVEQRSRTYETGAGHVGPRRGSVRIDVREQPRHTPTQITELQPCTRSSCCRTAPAATARRPFMCATSARSEVRLQRRDLELFELLLERRVETLGHLHRLAFDGKAQKTARNRLIRLRQGGYIERVALSGIDGQLLAEGDSEHPVASVYRLTPKGIAALRLRHRAGAELRGRPPRGDLTDPSIPHQLAVNRVGDWLHARLIGEHELDPAGKDRRHRPDGAYHAGRTQTGARSCSSRSTLATTPARGSWASCARSWPTRNPALRSS